MRFNLGPDFMIEFRRLGSCGVRVFGFNRKRVGLLFFFFWVQKGKKNRRLEREKKGRLL